MAKTSPLMIAPPLIFAGFVALAYFGMGRDDPQGLPSVLVGKPAPDLPQEALEGFTPAAPDALHSGEITLVNFWASWCPPCRAEHPKLLEMQADGLRIIGVNFKDTEANAVSYLNDDGNPFIAAPVDPQGRVALNWGVTAPPETFIVNGDGTVLFRFAGPLVGSDYEQRFLPALKEALGE